MPETSSLQGQVESMHEAVAAALLPAFAPMKQNAKDDANSKAGVIPVFQDHETTNTFYPTPAPTSEPPSEALASSPRRVASQEAAAAVPARGPPAINASLPLPAKSRVLKQIGLVRVPVTGTEIRLGRSSQSCDVALSATNRLVSRVHVLVSYIQQQSGSEDLVRIECTGWNGLQVSVPQEKGPAKSYDVVKNQVIYIERVEGITLDIHGERALLEFDDPEELTEEELASEYDHNIPSPQSEPVHAERILDVRAHPARQITPSLAESDREVAAGSIMSIHAGAPIPSSPMSLASSVPIPMTATPVPAQPEPSPALSVPLEAKETAPIPPSEPTPDVIESTPDDINENTIVDVAEQAEYEALKNEHAIKLEESGRDSTAEPEEGSIKKRERKPRRKYGPKMRLQPPRALKRAQSEEIAPAEKRLKPDEEIEIVNVAVNLLALAKLSTTPLSQLREANSQLGAVSDLELKQLLSRQDCIGVITAEGVDWAGQPLEPEYYYVPEKDSDEVRRSMVATSRHRSLRNCRKGTHKEFYYYTKQ